MILGPCAQPSKPMRSRAVAAARCRRGVSHGSLATALAVLAALALAACGFGKEGIALSESDPDYNGAVLFATRCSSCHTLGAAGAQGTGNRSMRTQGPNLDQRTETYQDALFAIQNGGFSGAIMPQNIVVGPEAEAVARFVAKYAGQEVETSPRPVVEAEAAQRPSAQGKASP